jgi:hypothetical protein
MQTTSLSGGASQALLLQQLMSLASTASSSQTSQAVSSQTAGSAGSIQGPPPGPPPSGPPPTGGNGGSDLFSPDTLSALTSSQTGDDSSSSGIDAAANTLASDLISQFGSNGSLSLSDVESALGASSSSSTSTASSSSLTNASSTLSSAFASLDTNGDGTLSASELAAGIEDAVANAPQGPPPGGPPPAAARRFGRRRSDVERRIERRQQLDNLGVGHLNVHDIAAAGAGAAGPAHAVRAGPVFQHRRLDQRRPPANRRHVLTPARRVRPRARAPRAAAVRDPRQEMRPECSLVIWPCSKRRGPRR